MCIQLRRSSENQLNFSGKETNSINKQALMNLPFSLAILLEVMPPCCVSVVIVCPSTLVLPGVLATWIGNVELTDLGLLLKL